MDVPGKPRTLLAHRRIPKPLQRIPMLQAVLHLVGHERAEHEVVDGETRLVQDEEAAGDAIYPEPERHDGPGREAGPKAGIDWRSASATQAVRRDVGHSRCCGARTGTEEVRISHLLRHGRLPGGHVLAARSNYTARPFD